MFTCLFVCAFLLMCACEHAWVREELNQACCLFSALQGQEMFTAVSLCCSPASSFWRATIQLQLNKTSNRDATNCRYLCPIPTDFHATCKDTDALWIHQRCFPLATVVRFTPFPPRSPKLGRIRFADISLHTRQDLISLQGSHPQSVCVYSSSSSSSLALLLSRFQRRLRRFIWRRPAAVKVVVWASGLDHIWLKNIKPFGSFLFAFFLIL